MPPGIREKIVLHEGSEIDRGFTTNQSIHKNVHSQVEGLRRRARELLAEAKVLEVAMVENRANGAKQKTRGQDSLIDELFVSNVTTITMLADELKAKRWSPDNLILIIERIHERQVLAMGKALVTSDNGFQIGDTRNSAESCSKEYNRLDRLINLLIEAASLVDEEYKRGTNPNNRWTGRVEISLSSRLKELRRADNEAFQKRLSLLAKKDDVELRGPKGLIQDLTLQSLGVSEEKIPQTSRIRNMNVSAILELGETIPLWFPRSLIPLCNRPNRRLDPRDIKSIEKDVLPGSQFHCTATDSVQFATLFRGNIRTRVGLIDSSIRSNNMATIFDEIIEKLEKAGLADRVQLFMLLDPLWTPNTTNEPVPKPVIIALSKAVDPCIDTKLPSIRQWGLAPLSSAFSIFLSFIYAISCFALNPIFFESIQRDMTPLVSCVPLFAGVLGMQVIHELAHRFFAARSETKIGFPVLLPSTQLGTFGSITPLHSFPRNRTAMFDFSVSGPFAGMIASLASMTGGVFATVYASAEALSRFPVTPAALFKSSYLTGSLISMLAPKVMLLPLSQPVPMHPLFFIGFAGLISNALNMLPIGRLDGGRAYYSIFGSRSAAQASAATLSFLVLLAITGESSLYLFWGAVAVLFQREAEIPVQNELPEVDDIRIGVYLGVLALASLSLAPFPGGFGVL